MSVVLEEFKGILINHPHPLSAYDFLQQSS